METGFIAEVDADGVVVGRGEEFHRFNRLACGFAKLDESPISLLLPVFRLGRDPFAVDRLLLANGAFSFGVSHIVLPPAGDVVRASLGV